MRAIFLLILPFLMFGADFITKKEHASMLYKNPRGIGCNKCHGENGEGLLISKYKDKNKKTKEIIDKELVSPPINNLTIERFKNGLENPKSVMPSYFLTDEEIVLLYDYVSSLKDKKPKKGAKK
ncbi:c-type cytochrome [Campylobacter suis]|uniref:Cytochrome c domain-containing protein n=1 Tax=Campylobacter suis TaxID=2790657 RepID=A0ABM8Q1E1_9BACT|nr:cytochrome c [Campylobacter suis]CAD7286587.1 hypothetical protein LMG8286_00420 [Campylobacter suis]